tara:strand:- start:10963 stop:11136 length:174 start_codon:yes stop_codon:yes gene_type:complete
MNEQVDSGSKTPYVIVGMSWADYLVLGAYFQEIKAKFSEYNILMCYYRKDLEEDICN